MVLGGTFAVGLILLPWDHRHDFIEGLRGLYQRQSLTYRRVLLDCLETLKSQNLVVDENYQRSLYAVILKDGYEMIQLGIKKEKIEQILFDRVHFYGRRKRKVANAIRSLAKYPPAFGLMGTVLGLVNVMRGVSTGQDSKATALEMAIALIATMYGLVVANLLINPAGEMILKKTVEEESFGEIAIHTICLLADQHSLLESQEILNSFVPMDHRVSVLGLGDEEMVA
jgi:chemotaxis protein MotA